MNLIASVVQQLIAQRPSLIRTEIEPIYQKRKATKSRPEVEEYLAVLDYLCTKYFTRIYIVIDALDEYTEENNARRTLLRECQRAHHCIHLMVTSRHIPGISRQLSKPVRIEIQAKDQDIMQYAEERISTSERMNMLIPKDAELRESIKQSITEKASGL